MTLLDRPALGAATFPHRPRIDPAELASTLGLPPPTVEQAGVIAAPLTPAVVVAGAGSGKTETMSARVVWLVANGYVDPAAVLGLTFTNKAAAELAGRLRLRLAQLHRHELAPELVSEPTVLTYHAYAARLVAEHGLRLAVEPTARLLTEAMCWQLAARVVRSHDADLPHLDCAETTAVGHLLDLSAEMAEHLVTGAELDAWTASLRATIEGLPPGPRYPRPSAEVRKILTSAEARRELLPLVERYQQVKRTAGAMDFGDQMSLAAQIGATFGEVGRIERARYPVVLLDEFQDTGHSQLVLLRCLFGGGHPVTAVGDPCQSIYGWRGASAGNLARFGAHFPARDGVPAAVLPLSTSFRNDRRVLDVANRIAVDLRATGIDVGVLAPGPRARGGTVRAALLSTVVDEAAWLAGRIAEVWDEDAPARAAGRSGRTIAVLCRRRSQFERIAAHLRARGVPVELVGLGGLLATPEVRDVVSTLRVVADPTAGDAAVRLLTGARWRLGPRDLAELGRRARQLARSASDQERADDVSLVEAIDDPGPAERYSPDGALRLEALRRELARLRRRVGQPLPDLVADVERALLLDIEVSVARDGAGPGAGRVQLDRFLDVAARFAQDAEVATLGAFLAFLEAAEVTERGLEAGAVAVDADRVQVLTVHAAKGLEWDVVAVPGLCTGVFPDAGVGSGWATSPGSLPFALRGDAEDLPDFEPAAADDQAELERLRREHVQAVRQRAELEERRLAYVAVTRARQELLCSGYRWDEASRPREPGTFLTELATLAEVDRWAAAPTEDEVNPVLATREDVPWPVDPLGARRADVHSGATLVRSALLTEPVSPTGALLSPADVVAAGWRREADLLLAERAGRTAATERVDVPLPPHLTVSGLVRLSRDPAELARQIRRPLPYRPAPMARRGTAFHSWLEERYRGQRLLDLDELPGAADADSDGDSDADLARLQAAFEVSEWADRTPVEVEVPFEMIIAGFPVRGRMDAVFTEPGGRFAVVDWKTGARPSGAAARAAAVQLAAYRLAWAQLAGAPPEAVGAAFHYVRHGVTVRPIDLLDEQGLVALLTGVPQA
ncbi:MAG: ATP-dependent helicase [Actinobacteria bacterium]|nr:ATP-dependent helicase [Actinomycetota bacterium]